MSCDTREQDHGLEQLGAAMHTGFARSDNDASPPVVDAKSRKQRCADTDEIRTVIERCVLERTESLQAANRELEAFVSSVSHELRAPLMTINGFTTLILEQGSNQISPNVHSYLQRILAAERRMWNLIDALLMLSRLECAQLGGCEIDLMAMLHAIIDELKAREPYRRVEAQVEQLPRIYGDGVLIRQAFENLLSNAFKYTRGRNVAKIHVGYYADSGELVFFVRDNGAGFDMRQVGKLFGVFARLHRADEFEGVGVGLALVSRIARRHGGRVWAEGELNVGATLYLALPQSRQYTPDQI